MEIDDFEDFFDHERSTKERSRVTKSWLESAKAMKVKKEKKKKRKGIVQVQKTRTCLCANPFPIRDSCTPIQFH